MKMSSDKLLRYFKIVKIFINDGLNCLFMNVYFIQQISQIKVNFNLINFHCKEMLKCGHETALNRSFFVYRLFSNNLITTVY